MLVAWMSYATLLTAALVCAALAGEGIARVWSAPRRLPWLIALAITVVAPVLLAFRPPATPPAAPAVVVRTASAPIVASAARYVAMPATPIRRPLSARLEQLVLPAWLITSLAFLAAFVIAALRLRLQSRSWSETLLDRTPVLISPSVGPAVVGALRPRIVIPAWTLTLDEAKRALMLRHEIAHIDARDPLVLRFATLALTLFPWNAPLWFIVRRLRHSVEIDCDARVLRGSGGAFTTRDYGMLLLLVGAHRTSRPALTTAFAGYPPFLERRIKAMTPTRTSRPALVSTALIAVLATSTIAATRAPVPASLLPARHGIAPLSRNPRAPRPVVPTLAPVVSRAPVRTSAEQRTVLPSPIQLDTLPILAIADTPVELPPQARATSRPAGGRVLDSATNAPLANVYVRVIGVQALGEPNWACSDADGIFRINVPVGEAWLSAQSADHSFARVILAPADSVAVLRGAFVPPSSPSADKVSLIAVTPIPTRQRPLIIVDGVVQPPAAGDSAHLFIRTAGGETFERAWKVGDPQPVLIVDGVPVTWGATAPPFSNPCVK